MPRAEKWTKKRKEQKRMEAEYCPARRLGSSTMAGRANGIAIHCARCHRGVSGGEGKGVMDGIRGLFR